MRNFKTIFTTREITARANVKGYYHEWVNAIIRDEIHMNRSNTKYAIEIGVAGATKVEERKYELRITFKDSKADRKVIWVKQLNNSQADCIIKEYERFKLKF